MIVLKRITSAGKSTVACARRGCNGVTCYIQPKCAKQPISAEKLRFFDFEADSTHGGYHIPNYATVGETFNVYHNKGRSIIDQFCEGEFCEANKGTTFIAHNAKGYDAQFIRCVSEWSQNRGIEDPGIQCELHSSILSAFPKVGLAGKCDFVDLVSFE
jgi:hypothetical protein